MQNSRTRGRPKLGHTRKVTIPAEMYADLKQIAGMRGTSVASVMRDSYAHYIKHVM